MSAIASELPDREYTPASVRLADLPAMPEAYRKTLVRLMAMQAYAERCGALELAPWVQRAPGYVERRVLARIMSDEAHHAYLLYRELDAMGVSEDEAIAIAEGRGTVKGPSEASMAGPKAVADPDNVWDDVVLNNMFLDRAGRHMVSNFAESSYAPWARVCRRIVRDEKLHEGFGLQQLKRLIAAGGDRDALARRVTRWYALGLNFFGPPQDPGKIAFLRRWGLKRSDNETLRRAYRSEVATIMDRLGAADLLRLSHDRFPYA